MSDLIRLRDLSIWGGELIPVVDRSEAIVCMGDGDGVSGVRGEGGGRERGRGCRREGGE